MHLLPCHMCCLSHNASTHQNNKEIPKTYFWKFNPVILMIKKQNKDLLRLSYKTSSVSWAGDWSIRSILAIDNFLCFQYQLTYEIIIFMNILIVQWITWNLDFSLWSYLQWCEYLFAEFLEKQRLPGCFWVLLQFGMQLWTVLDVELHWFLRKAFQ